MMHNAYEKIRLISDNTMITVSYILLVVTNLQKVRSYIFDKYGEGFAFPRCNEWNIFIWLISTTHTTGS